LLGIAEAGFFPGVILYLTYWYPAARRAQITAAFMTAIAFSGMVGGPLSGWIMQTMAGVNGWAGWQWLFLLEGLPSILMGGLVFFLLDDTIVAARWLTAPEKERLAANIAADARDKTEIPWWHVLRDGGVLLLAAVYFLLVMGLYGIGFWLPQLIRNAGVNAPLAVGLLSVIPYACAAVGMIWLGRRSDRRQERRWHIAFAAVAGAVGLAVSGGWGDQLTVAMVALTLATTGILATLPIFWTLPTARLAGASAAAGIGLINSFGNLAGFVSPSLIGYIQDFRGNPTWGLYAIALCLGLGALLVLIGVPGRKRS
jgi:MFS family permease